MEYDVEKLSAKIGRKNAIKKILKKIFTTVLIIVGIINIMFFAYNIKGEESQNIFGIRFFNIVSRKYATSFKH